MEIIGVTKENIADEHICCAISEKKGENCAGSKKAWMSARFDDGLVFKKLNARGKVFIEYIPAENAWCPIDASGFMFINCLWVSGQFKGQGWADRLLEECISDSKAKGKAGLVILSAKKKMPFLSDPGYLKYKGFAVCDTAEPYYELLHLPFTPDAPKPRFKNCCKAGKIDGQGYVLYYSNQCPHTEKYAPVIAEMARQKGVAFTLIKLESMEQAQSSPAPFTSYSLFHNGGFVTNEILSENKFAKMLEERK